MNAQNYFDYIFKILSCIQILCRNSWNCIADWANNKLQGLIEEFVTREGTDTGYTDGSLDENVEMVRRQLKRGDVLIVYDGDTQTANIVPKKNARMISHEEK